MSTDFQNPRASARGAVKAPDIQKEWDSFIEYPERSNKMYVTTTSALLFARYITLA